MAMPDLDQSSIIFLQEPHRQIYSAMRTGYVAEGVVQSMIEIKEKLPDYPDIKIASSLGRMEIFGIVKCEPVEKDGRKVFGYRPHPQSEWAVLIDRTLGFDPTEVKFDWESLGK